MIAVVSSARGYFVTSHVVWYGQILQLKDLASLNENILWPNALPEHDHTFVGYLKSIQKRLNESELTVLS